MLVSGPIGAIATGSGMAASRLAMRSTAPSGSAAAVAGSSSVSPIPLSPWTSVARTTEPSSAPAAPSADRDVVPAVGVEQAQGVLGAVGDVRVAADRGDGQQVELGPGDREADRQRVVEPRVAVDDQRQRVLDGPERRRPGVAAAPWNVGRARTSPRSSP